MLGFSFRYDMVPFGLYTAIDFDIVKQIVYQIWTKSELTNETFKNTGIITIILNVVNYMFFVHLSKNGGPLDDTMRRSQDKLYPCTYYYIIFTLATHFPETNLSGTTSLIRR